MIARVFDGKPEGLTRGRRPRQRHALLADEHRDLLGAPLLGQRAHPTGGFFDARGHQDPGRRERLPRRDLSRRRGAGRRRPIPSSSTTTSSPRAATSPPGSSRSSSSRDARGVHGRCAGREAASRRRRYDMLRAARPAPRPSLSNASGGDAMSRRNRPSSPPLSRRRGHDRRCRPARPDGSADAQSSARPAAARDQAGDEHVVRPAEADRCRRPERRIRRGRPRRWPAGHPSARLALRHSQLRRCRAAAGIGGLPGDRPLSARLWHDALSSERDVPQRPAVGAGRRCHRADGCAEDREGDPRRLRLGRADRQHRRGALAGALQGAGLRQRLSDRQPGSRQDAAAAQGRARNGGTSIISPPSAAEPATRNTGTSSRSSSGSSLRRSGTSTTPRSIAAPPPSTIRITSPS